MAALEMQFNNAHFQCFFFPQQGVNRGYLQRLLFSALIAARFVSQNAAADYEAIKL